MKREEYKAYLQSAAWVRLRQLSLKRFGNRCAVCYSNGPLSVHHRTYERVGNEDVEDLVPLCERCHKLFHGECEDGIIMADVQQAKDSMWSTLNQLIELRDAIRMAEDAEDLMKLKERIDEPRPA